MDMTGARWGLTGAEAILKLRAVRSNGDFDEYWNYHLSREKLRAHQSCYADKLRLAGSLSITPGKPEPSHLT